MKAHCSGIERVEVDVRLARRRLLVAVTMLPVIWTLLAIDSAMADSAGWQIDSTFGQSGEILGERSQQSSTPRISFDGRGRLLALNVNSDVARFDQSGHPDSTFGPRGGYQGNAEISNPRNFYPFVNDIEEITGGRLITSSVLVDQSRENSESYLSNITRFTQKGAIDNSLNGVGRIPRLYPYTPSSPRIANAVEELKDGSFVIGGGQGYTSNPPTPAPSATVRKYGFNGEPDRGFGNRGVVKISARRGAGTYQEITDLDITSRGQILAVGYSRGSSVLLKLRPDGRRDKTFGGGDGIVRHQISTTRGCFAFTDDRCHAGARIIQSPKGLIYVLDSTYAYRRGFRARLFAYGAAGRPIHGFGDDGKVFYPVIEESHETFVPTDLTFSKTNKILLVGSVVQGDPRDTSNPSTSALMRVRPDGSPDSTFAESGLLAGAIPDLRFGRSVLEDPQGRLIVAGIRQSETGDRPVVARIVQADNRSSASRIHHDLDGAP